MIGYFYDNQGFITHVDYVDENTIGNYTLEAPNGFNKPKWDGVKWTEGMSTTELDEIHENTIEQDKQLEDDPSQQIKDLQAENESLKAEIASIKDELSKLKDNTSSSVDTNDKSEDTQVVDDSSTQTVNDNAQSSN